MKLFQIIIVVSAVSAWSIESENLARFHRILKKYQNPVYKASDKKITGNFMYSANENGNKPEMPDITSEAEETHNFARNFFGSGGFRGTWLQSDTVQVMSHHVDLRGYSQYSKNSTISARPLWEEFDTVAHTNLDLIGQLNYTFDFERHFGFGRCKGLPFWSVLSNVQVNGDERRSKHCSNRDVVSGFVNKETRRDGAAVLDVIPGLGFGRLKPVLPVYRAFEFERTLKKQGVISSNLSDSTMTALIALNASIKTYQLKNDYYAKYFMEELVKTVTSDVSVVGTQINAFTLYKLFETVSARLPDFYSGVKTSVNQRNHSEWDYYRSKIYSGERVLDSSSSEFTAKYWLFVKFDIIYPVLPRLFFELSLMKSGVVPEPESDKDSYQFSYYYPTDGAYFGYDLYDLKIKGVFHSFLTNRILMNCGVEFMNRANHDQRRIYGFLDFNFFIEDHLSLYCNMSKSTMLNQGYYQNLKFKYKSGSELISLGLTYDL